LEKRVTLGNEGHTWKKSRTWKIGSLLALVAFERSHLEKFSSLEKWVTLGKTGHTWKNVTLAEKRGALGKIGHT